MRIPSYTKQFAKDMKRMRKRGKSPDKVKEVVKKLIDEEHLEGFSLCSSLCNRKG